jgi:hypothetical protein
MIEITKLTPEDVGRLVIYRTAPTFEPQEGRITSFNDKYIFVDYTNVGRGNATRPEDLEFTSGN